MTAVSIRLTSEVATVECEQCGGSESVATTDRSLLLTEVREFLHAHELCLGRGLRDARMP
jgi:hypothetical protein